MQNAYVHQSDRVGRSPIESDSPQQSFAKTIQKAKVQQSDRVRQSPIESDCISLLARVVRKSCAERTCPPVGQSPTESG